MLVVDQFAQYSRQEVDGSAVSMTKQKKKKKIVLMVIEEEEEYGGNSPTSGGSIVTNEVVEKGEQPIMY